MKVFRKINNNYYASSMLWSTFSKVLNAVLGFVSVPLLIGYFGKADYGLLSIATACNGYMHLMDLGMNTGAVKFFSQWEAEGKRDLIRRVSATNATFYIIISLINILGLLLLAIFGEPLFSVTHEQFQTLRVCFLILAFFSTMSWLTTVYTQLLTAYKKIDFTMKVQSAQVVMKAVLIVCIFVFDFRIIHYFFFLTLITSIALIPYMYKCKKDGYIESYKPASYWGEFRIVLSFSISIFALSLFQVSATQARPIVLSIVAEHGAEAVADYRIVEVIPQFIIMMCGTLSSIFLPKSSEMLVNNSKEEIQSYVNTWTLRTTLLVVMLCFPFIVGSEAILSAYVGKEYSYLGKWLVVWLSILIIQMHSTPAYSFILANGKTKLLVITTALACVLSIVVNALLCKNYSVGSAVIGYVIYILCLIGVYYYIDKKYIGLNIFPILSSFFKPVIIAVLCAFVVWLLPLDILFSYINLPERPYYIIVFIIKAITWVIPYLFLLSVTKIIVISKK